MGALFEALFSMFASRKMDDVHEKSPTAFWVIFWTMVAGSILIIVLAGD